MLEQSDESSFCMDNLHGPFEIIRHVSRQALPSDLVKCVLNPKSQDFSSDLFLRSDDGSSNKI